MVTGVSTTNQSAYISVTNNTQKTNSQSETESVSTKNDIEDTYVPSFDFKETGAEFYENIAKTTGYLGAFEKSWFFMSSCISTSKEGGIMCNGPDSFDNFKNYIKGMAIQDYTKQNPDNEIFPFIQREMPESLKEYLDSIDYEKEYEEYKQSRGCSTDEELKIVSSSPFQTKDQLIQHASMIAFGTVLSMQDKGFTSRSFEGVNFNDVFKSMDLKDVANYINAYSSAENYQQSVFAFQALCDVISEQENISNEVRNLFAGYSQDIDNSKEKIAKFSDEIEEQNKKQEMKEKYNSSLISKYAS